MLTIIIVILIAILIHLYIVAINITLILWIILSSDDMKPCVKNNAYTFFIIFCPIINILGALILIFGIGSMWLLKYNKWLNNN